MPVFVLALALATALAQDAPSLIREGEQVLLVDLPAVLGERAVAEQLQSGLTTSLVFRVTGPRTAGDRAEGGARVEIRFEPWDQVYHVGVLTLGDGSRREVLPSSEALAAWWRQLRLPVLRAAGGGQARVRLDVVPFSAAEQRDAQRWFARTLEHAGEPGAESIGEEAGSVARLFNLLLATSIQRRTLATYRWSAPLAAAGGAG